MHSGKLLCTESSPKSGMDERHRLPPDGKRRTENSTLTNQWKEIRRISELCCEAAQSNTVGNRARPIFSLIRALAVLQCTRDFKKCEEIIQGIGVDLFTRSPRMRVPFIYCDQDGPIYYNGMIEKLEGRTAWIHLETDDPYLSGMHKVRYRMVGVTSMNNPPRENEYLRG